MSEDRDVDQAHDSLQHSIKALNASSSLGDLDGLGSDSDSSSELDCLSRTPSQPEIVTRSPEAHHTIDAGEVSSPNKITESNVPSRRRSARIKRKTTGSKSKHFSPVKKNVRDTLTGTPLQRRIKKEVETAGSEVGHSSALESSTIIDGDEQPVDQNTPKRRSPRLKRKTTGSKSDHFSPRPKIDPALFDRVDLYNPQGGVKKKSTAGISINPVPSILADRFGIVQERLWQEPFWLIIAVVFLNQTTGRAAMPVFWALKAQYTTIEAVANADVNSLRTAIEHLGLGNQRSKRIIAIAKVWLSDPPTANRRHRTLHYPSPGDGKALKPDQVLEDDATLSPGALELGHMPGCKQYAYDSWRIFCRDVLRGVADDYRGFNAVGNHKSEDAEDAEEEFEPEWKRVVPLDKELRACLRWMWLKEGFIWDPLTGEKRPADEREMEMAVRGQMEMGDAKERRFAELAVRNSAAAAAAEDDDDAREDEVEGESEGECEEEEGEEEEEEEEEEVAAPVHDSEQILDSPV
jgi:hypothetical protein